MKILISDWISVTSRPEDSGWSFGLGNPSSPKKN